MVLKFSFVIKIEMADKNEEKTKNSETKLKLDTVKKEPCASTHQIKGASIEQYTKVSILFGLFSNFCGILDFMHAL